MPFTLAKERAERALADKKPLFTLAEARAESERCLYCTDAPCIKACPTEIDVPTFIKQIATGNERGSARTIFAQNILGASCARVCPVEVLCEGACVYTGWGREPIAIGRLQRFATDAATRTPSAGPPLLRRAAPSGRKVALVGAGPASLACAAYLALDGHAAVIFEKHALPGGLNTTGVAPYKLHAEDALREVEWIVSLGVEIRTGVEVGRDVPVAELLRGYDAVFLGLGLGEDTRLGVPGEDGPGVLGATAWIERMKLAPAADRPRGRVVVVGGGNTAIDVARECAQLGAAEVTLVYRRGAEAMSAYAHEVDGARHDGVRVLTERKPVAFLRDASGALTGVRCARPGGAEEAIACDLAVLAIGQSKLRALAQELPGVEIDARGSVVVDRATGRTGNPRVYSGGDCTNGGKEVVNAVADGRNTARHLHKSFA